MIDKLMNANQINNTSIITIGNYGFREFILNWILSLKKYGYNKFVIFSFDQPLVDHLTEKGYQDNVILVPSYWLDYNLTTSFSGWGDNAYKLLTKSKTNIWYNLLLRNYSFLYSDPDVVWLSSHILDHIKFQYENSFAEVLFAQDLDNREIYCNTGFFYATPTQFVKSLFTNFIEQQRLPKHNATIDQHVFQGITRINKFNDTRIDTLDFLLFANGNVHFSNNLNRKMSIPPLVVHANYLNGEKEKMSKLKSRGYWLL
jgi:hypothetical protein